MKTEISREIIAQSPGAVSYTDCISTEGEDSPNEYPVNNTQQSNGQALVMLGLWGMRNTPLLLLIPGPLWPGVVAPNKVLYRGQIELNCVFMLN